MFHHFKILFPLLRQNGSSSQYEKHFSPHAKASTQYLHTNKKPARLLPLQFSCLFASFFLHEMNTSHTIAAIYLIKVYRKCQMSNTAGGIVVSIFWPAVFNACITALVKATKTVSDSMLDAQRS